ncbi:MAG: sulfite exporter TauE/SafE family protein, partial [Candidatus Heimdallarchaeota archaeon]|nr:sulfite exporter TauE/SafE family protein [Candidatus Heimdallarchaeota archaeon]
GIIYVPVLSAVSGLPIHIAAATSTAMIVVVSLVGFITRSSSRIEAGTFDLSLLSEFGLPLLIGSIIGARFGALKVKKIKSRELLTFFWTVAILAGIRILMSEFF